MLRFAGIVPSAAARGACALLRWGGAGTAISEVGRGPLPRAGGVRAGIAVACSILLLSFDRCLLLYLEPTGLPNSTLLPLYMLCVVGEQRKTDSESTVVSKSSR